MGKGRRVMLDRSACTRKDLSALRFFERNPMVPINLTYSKTILFGKNNFPCGCSLKLYASSSVITEKRAM